MNDTYSIIERAIHYMAENHKSQPDLSAIASSVHLSEFYFQRVFTTWAGISPKRFMQFLTKQNAKRLLASSNILEAAAEAGLSSPSRLHDLMINTEAVTPGEYRSKGAGLTIHFGFHPTPFGEALIGVTQRGICFLGFVHSDHDSLFQEMAKDWPAANLVEDVPQTQALISVIFSSQTSAPLNLHLCGTNFQLKVWEAMLRIPFGGVSSYKRIADQIGIPGAERAIGGAVGRNNIAFLIPCHRVIREVGGFGEYRYGTDRKLAILGWEFARLSDKTTELSAA